MLQRLDPPTPGASSCSPAEATLEADTMETVPAPLPAPSPSPPCQCFRSPAPGCRLLLTCRGNAGSRDSGDGTGASTGTEPCPCTAAAYRRSRRHDASPGGGNNRNSCCGGDTGCYCHGRYSCRGAGGGPLARGGCYRNHHAGIAVRRGTVCVGMRGRRGLGFRQFMRVLDGLEVVGTTMLTLPRLPQHGFVTWLRPAPQPNPTQPPSHPSHLTWGQPVPATQMWRTA